MGFIDTLKERAKANVKTIVLPETEDKRTLAATEKILKEGIAKVILVGNEEAVKKSAAEDGYDISGAQIVDPATSEKTQGYIDKLVELRQKKGMTPDQAKEILLNQYLYYGVMMVKMGDADGMVSGACHSTADTLRPCLQILKTKPGTKLVSAFFLMVVPNCEYGANGAFVFADSGLNQNPTSEELAANLAKSIVIEAAELLECFQWSDEEYDLQHVKEELADVLVYSKNLLDKLELDADEIINMKMSQNEAKYPVDKAKGSAAKYDQL